MSAPAVQFAIGTSSTTAASAAETNVDKSLDDLIKDRRKEAAAVKKQRAGPKSNATSRAKKPSAADKSVGKGKAKRAAAAAARRGITASSKPTAMQVE